MSKSLLAIPISMAFALGALVLDPHGLFGEPDWQYDETQVRAAIEGNWTLTFTKDADRSTRKLQLSIRQAGEADQHSSRSVVQSAMACGSRTLVRSAAACGTSTSMPIVITVMGDQPRKLRSSFMIGGTTFEQGHLELYFESDLQQPMAFIGAQISPAGKVLAKVDTTPGYTATLVRTSAPAATAAPAAP